MSLTSIKDLFVKSLNELRMHEERTAEILQQISAATTDLDIKEVVDSHVFLKSQILDTVDRCFGFIGEAPAKIAPDRLHDVFAEDFRRQIAEIQSPTTKHLFALSRMNYLMHLRVAEYATLTSLADFSGHYAVGVLLETCLAEKRAFVERARHLMKRIVDSEAAKRIAA